MSDIYANLSKERKELQDQGLLPDWMTTNGWIMFKDKYLYDADNYKEQIQRIAKTLASHMIYYTDEWEKKFFDLMWKGWLAPSTPVLANCGTDRGMPVSCSGSDIHDSVEGFFDAYKEVAMLSKYGFGTSANLSNIRCRGTEFGGGDGKADGIVPVAKMLRNTIRQIRQTSRRGAGAWYLDIEHGDFYELCDYLKNNPDDLNIGWNIHDTFIEKLNAGDKESLARYQRALKIKMVTGKGYFHFIDRVNRLAPDAIKNSGIPIKSSNLCITGSQRVVTSNGMMTAKELFESGEELVLFDGLKPVSSSKMKLRGKNKDVWRVTLENGYSLEATAEHGFPVSTGTRNQTVSRVELKNLKIGDKVVIQTNKGLFGEKHMPDEAYLLGLYQGDGTQSGKNKENIHLCLWEDNFDLIEGVEQAFSHIHYKYGCDTYNKKSDGSGGKSVPPSKFLRANEGHSRLKKKHLVSRTLSKALDFKKNHIPEWLWTSDEFTQWQFIKGLFYTDGTVNITKRNGDPLYLSVTQVDQDYIKDVMLILNNLGMQVSLHMSSDGGPRILPDGKGGKKIYQTRPAYRLVIGNKNDALEFNRNTGFLDRKGKFIEDRSYRNNTKKRYKVRSIEYIGKQDVYCPTVNTDEHIFCAQGMQTYNCNEISLPSDDEYTFSCVLSSLNLSKYDEWKDTDAVFNSIVFLDCVAQEFIEKSKDNPSMKRVVRFTEDFRALGLGTLGFHTYLQSKMIPFEGLEARNENVNIFGYIRDEAERATQWLAKEKGEPKFCEGLGRRNATLMAIAPNMSSSLLCGSVSQGIEPVYKNVYNQGSASGNMERINPVLLQILKDRGKKTKPVIKSIIDNKGSVQHLDFLSDKEKLVFKTAFEIDQKAILMLASHRQRYIDQSQSLNLFFSSEESEEYIGEIHSLAFNDKYIKGLYYIRSENGVAPVKTECLACEG